MKEKSAETGSHGTEQPVFPVTQPLPAHRSAPYPFCTHEPMKNTQPAVPALKYPIRPGTTRMLLLLLILVPVVLAASVSGFLLVEPFPGWKYRGEMNNNGIYSDDGFRPNGLELWNVSYLNSDIGIVQSSPAVAGGVVYVGDRSNHLFAMDADNGTIFWENYLPISAPTTEGDVWSSPAVWNGTVYIGNGRTDFTTGGAFYAFNASTGGSGTPLWQKHFRYGGVVSSPVEAYGLVYVGRQDHNVTAWNAVTGAEVWNFPTAFPVSSSPAVYNGSLYFSVPADSGGDNIFALNAMTGEKIWDAKNASGYDGTFLDGGNTLGSSPALADNVLYIGGFGGVFAFNAITGAQLHKFTDGQGSYYPAAPALAGGVVYFGTEGSSPHHFYALNANDLTVKWSNITPDDNDMVSSPAVANGTVYITSFNGNDDSLGFLYAWNASTGVPLWNFHKTGMDGSGSSPAVANGVVYFGTWDYGLIAVGTEPTGSSGRIGVVRSGTTWLLDRNGNGSYGAGDLTYSFGKAGDKPVTGDWNTDGRTETGVVRSNTTWLLDRSGDGKYGAGDLTYTFGKAGDVPVTGDWDGDGMTEIGVVRSNTTWLLDRSGDGKYGAGDLTYTFGKAGDVPVTGDWDHDGMTEIGVVRSGKTWLLDASGNGAYGAGDLTYNFGKAGDVPVTSDWDHDGMTEIGVVRSSTTWLLDASGNGAYGAGDYTYTFGKAGDKPVTGKW
jgi:outer membrane protein assembly factor BamB